MRKEVFSRVWYQIFYIKRGKTQDESKGKREYVGQHAGSGFQAGSCDATSGMDNA